LAQPMAATKVVENAPNELTDQRMTTVHRFVDALIRWEKKIRAGRANFDCLQCKVAKK
jgi:hypothetical protein